MQNEQDLIAKSSVVIAAPKAAVWKALVTPALIKRYMFGSDVRSDWKEGSPITFSGEWQGKPYQDKGVVLRVQPERVLRYSHFSPLSGKPDRPENYHTVTIELADAAGQTSVTLTQDNNPTADARAHSETNWNMMLGALKQVVEGGAK